VTRCNSRPHIRPPPSIQRITPSQYQHAPRQSKQTSPSCAGQQEILAGKRRAWSLAPLPLARFAAPPALARSDHSDAVAAEKRQGRAQLAAGTSDERRGVPGTNAATSQGRAPSLHRPGRAPGTAVAACWGKLLSLAAREHFGLEML
jgi:hypothetical protein